MNQPTQPLDEDLDELIDAAAGGDQRACTALYNRFVQAVYRLAYGVLLNQQDAEEVVQDSFGYAFQSLRRYDSARSSFRTWLYTITLSRCRNKRRRKWLPTLPLADMVEWLPGREPNPEAAVEQLSIREMVWNALGELSPKQREAIVLRYFDGLTYREMAMVLGCPLKTAESRVRLAHETLYQTLIQQHGKESLFGLFGYD
ncbi:MAG: RNA polymerase sigma factor [Chloroflexota bacterium]|jgi:RNA polymerase sigma-70 factor (ECF subfamily)